MTSFFVTETITVVGQRIPGGGITDPRAIRDFLDNWNRNTGIGNQGGGGGGGGVVNDNSEQESGKYMYFCIM